MDGFDSQASAINMRLEEACTDLIYLFGREYVLRKVEEIHQYSLDAYSRVEERPAVVVKPTSTKQLPQLFFIAKRYGLHVTPRGAGFDSAGGSMSRGGILVDMRELNKILSIDDENFTITVQSGVDFESVSKALDLRGFRLGLEPIASPKATIGGFIASNGVGYGSMMFGSISKMVRDLEVFFSDGSVIHTGFRDVPSYATGYDLTSMFIGSEGLLGIITETTLEIFPKPIETANIAFTFRDVEDGFDAVKEISKKVSTGFSAFIMDEPFIEILKSHSLDIPHKGFLGLIRLEGIKEVVELETNFIKTFCDALPQLGDRIWDLRFLYPIIEAMATPVLIDEYLVPTDKNADAYFALKDLTKHKVKSAFYSLQLDLDFNLVTFVLDIEDLNRAHIEYVKLEDEMISLGGIPYTAGLRRTTAMKKASMSSLLLRESKKVLDQANLLSPTKVGLQ